MVWGLMTLPAKFKSNIAYRVSKTVRTAMVLMDPMDRATVDRVPAFETDDESVHLISEDQ